MKDITFRLFQQQTQRLIMSKSTYKELFQVMVLLVALITSLDLAAKEKRLKNVRLEKIPQQVDYTWDELPRTYSATEPEQYTSWLEKIINAEPDIDEFSTEEDKEKRETNIHNKAFTIQPVGLFVKTSIDDFGATSCSLKYNPNEQKLTYQLFDSRYTEFLHSKRITDEKRKLTLKTVTTDQKEFIGTNQFGAEYDVTSWSKVDYSIPLEKSIQDVGSVILDPNDARKLVPNLKCVVIFSGKLPYLIKQWDTRAATIENRLRTSTEDVVLFGEILDVWLIDIKSRKILSKFSNK